MAARIRSNRKKRVKATLSRLKRRNRRLGEKLHSYRLWLGGLGAVALVLAFTLGFFAVEETQPDPVLIGKGKAGVNGFDTTQVAQQTPQEPAEREASADAPGQDIGSGEASYYGDELAGRPTASGETFNPGGLTAAHRTLPMGSRVRVTNVNNGKSVVVRVNDRGPFAKRRVIDLSEGAARRIGMLGAGTAMVRMELVK